MQGSYQGTTFGRAASQVRIRTRLKSRRKSGSYQGTTLVVPPTPFNELRL